MLTRTFTEFYHRKTTSMLPPAWIMVLRHFQVGLNWYVILKWALRELEGSQRLLPPFEGEHLERARTSWPTPISPKGKPLGSHMIGWKYSFYPNTPNIIEWIIDVRVHRNQVLGKSPIETLAIPTLGGLILEFQWDPG